MLASLQHPLIYVTNVNIVILRIHILHQMCLRTAIVDLEMNETIYNESLILLTSKKLTQLGLSTPNRSRELDKHF